MAPVSISRRISLQIQSPVATHVITGFLGVGKTTAIRGLLDRKPPSERWAVLINEFGEVGIDAALLRDNTVDDGGIVLRELPGGCLCCAAGVPFQVALTQLLRKVRPDRLLIEPTGLGHPRDILATLASPEYQGILDLRATLTLVDARKCSDARYREHAIFREQLQVADVVIANKGDLYGPDDLPALRALLGELRRAAEPPIDVVTWGQLDLAWLTLPAATARGSLVASRLPSAVDDEERVVAIPAGGYLRLDNSDGEYHSSGWIFDPAIEFDHDALFVLLSGLSDIERMKAVFITGEGIWAFNLAEGVLTSRSLDECADSRIEVIGRHPERWQGLEQGLLSCRRD